MKSSSISTTKDQGTLSNIMKYFDNEEDDDDDDNDQKDENHSEVQSQQDEYSDHHDGEEEQYEEGEEEDQNQYDNNHYSAHSFGNGGQEGEEEEGQYEEGNQEEGEEEYEGNENQQEEEEEQNKQYGSFNAKINSQSTKEPYSPHFPPTPKLAVNQIPPSENIKTLTPLEEQIKSNDEEEESDDNRYHPLQDMRTGGRVQLSNKNVIPKHYSSEEGSDDNHYNKSEGDDNEEQDEEEFLKQEEEKRSMKMQRESEQTQEELIRADIKKREEALRAELKRKEEALKEELRKKKEQQELLEKQLHQSESVNSLNTNSNNPRNPFIPGGSKPENISDSVNKGSIGEPSKRTSILLRSKKEELKLSKNNDNKNKTIFDQFNEEVLKDKYLIDEKIFDELTRNEKITAKNLNNYFQPALYNDSEEFKFRPKINEKSKQIVKEIEKKRLMQGSNADSQMTSTSRSKSPIELTLYDDAVKRWQKLEKVYLNNEMNIKLNASKTKISNNSHKIAICKLEKSIDEAVKKYSKNNTVSFLNIAQVLTELRVFREILNPKSNNGEVKKITDLKEKIAKVRDRETRKIEEINFLEQIWICLNPKNTETIKGEIFGEFMKILFSPVDSSVKEISSILKQFLQAALFLHNNNPVNNSGSSNNSETSSNPIGPGIISPITDKLISNQDIWPLPTLVKHFLLLKENIIAYKSTGNYSKDLQKELMQEREYMTFKPRLENSKIRMKIFEKKLPTFFEREKLRMLALQELKKEAEKAELEQCTFKPQINAKYNQNNNSFSGDNPTPVYDKLYKYHKDQKRKFEQRLEEKRKEELDKEIEGCTFKPKIYTRNVDLEKSFTAEKPKGFNQHVEHTRRGIIERFRKKYMLEKNPAGENYEKVRAKNIQPFNITDLRKQQDKELKEMMTRTKTEFNDYNCHDDEESDGNDEYFTIQVKIPSGKERTIRIYEDDDPYEIANNFCKTYCMKDEIKNRLAANICNFKNTYFKQQHNNNDDESGY